MPVQHASLLKVTDSKAPWSQRKYPKNEMLPDVFLLLSNALPLFHEFPGRTVPEYVRCFAVNRRRIYRAPIYGFYSVNWIRSNNAADIDFILAVCFFSFFFFFFSFFRRYCDYDVRWNRRKTKKKQRSSIRRTCRIREMHRQAPERIAKRRAKMKRNAICKLRLARAGGTASRYRKKAAAPGPI